MKTKRGASCRRKLKNTTTDIRVHYRNALQSISKIGQQLLKIKDILAHGQWTEWIEKEFTEPGYFTIHTAQNYMNLAKLVQSHGLENLKNLPLSVIYIVAREEEGLIQHVIEESKHDSSISRTRFRQIKQEYQKNQLLEKQAQEQSTATLKLTPATSPLVDKLPDYPLESSNKSSV